MNEEPREVKCSAYMQMTLAVKPQAMMQQRVGVSVESSRCSLDLSPAEAMEFAEALVWAAKGYGGHQGRSGT